MSRMRCGDSDRGKSGAGGFQPGAVRRAEDSVVTDLDRAGWQHVLQETAEKLFAGNSDVAHGLSPVVAVVEADVSVVDGFDAAVGNGDPEDIAAQVIQDFLS